MKKQKSKKEKIREYPNIYTESLGWIGRQQEGGIPKALRELADEIDAISELKTINGRQIDFSKRRELYTTIHPSGVPLYQYYYYNSATGRECCKAFSRKEIEELQED
ncbi:hypothetical protein HN832_01615 [archaeon]|jgi:hypothetical protein|nr:hypothetical protein [archaeon]MBT4373053.1 hypothetical protein [archaeon]MBT4531398.1 hypothetical protein [archaeon]MBT7001424.1 hypothetical protein [archaeon]MBT7282090.1 hypothetical protein [archaeon]